MRTSFTSAGLTPVSRRRYSMPVLMAPFASCTCLMSLCERYTASVRRNTGFSPDEARAVPQVRVARPRGRLGEPAVPVDDPMGHQLSHDVDKAATADAIWWGFTDSADSRLVPPLISNDSMAPVPALMPKVMFIPSKAGPAAVEEATRRPFSAITISPLVPISMKRVMPLRSWSLVASIPEVISAPTKPEMMGGR